MHLRPWGEKRIGPIFSANFEIKGEAVALLWATVDPLLIIENNIKNKVSSKYTNKTFYFIIYAPTGI